MARLELDSFYNKPAPRASSSSLTSRAEQAYWLPSHNEPSWLDIQPCSPLTQLVIM
nr:unnamed protein product [Digitaria exilis]